jgi:hypothetical protein
LIIFYKACSTGHVALGTYPGFGCGKTTLIGAFLLMSVRLIAQDLYRIIREVDKLEKELLAAPAQDHELLKERLRKAIAERDLMRRSLEGSKDAADVLKKYGSYR